MTSTIGSFDEQSQTSRDPQDPIPTPWESFSAIAELIYRHKVGVVVERGTPETSLGTDLAVYAAEAGIPTLLCTPRRPPHVPPLLLVDTHAHPTSSRINERLQAQHRGKEFGFLVVEDYERMSPDEYPYVGTGTTRSTTWTTNPPRRRKSCCGPSRCSGPACLPCSPPLLPTTPDTSRSLLETFPAEHPASVLTDACKPVLTLHRTDLRTVQARVDLSSTPGAQLVTLLWPTVPAMRTLAELRQSLTAYGAAGDRDRFDTELDAIALDDLDQISGIVQTYRQRVIQRTAAAILPAQATDEPDDHQG
ncbi:hypothetical protein Shyd_18770 [Streptomyces hydrogenans]|uniref:Uncharacterized protein n=2 Tax=Streptomyces hydrogenans TaxID=1873719 RepID=A0ABQ3P660_9ACTN|nr:hypothetical protein [Streptomyces hydrogenans]GHI20506.1 hypothetical protein Shyd_18770 [Streptomyces hydrogenans]